MGVVVMLLTGFLLVQYFKSVNKTQVTEKTLSTATEQTSTDSGTPAVKAENANPGKLAQNTNQTIKPGTEYTVQPGDSLWDISVKAYGSGYEWSKVYAANKQTIGQNPGLITSGTKITLPQTTVAKAVEYTVKSGDNLWNISTSICGSGYGWTQIATDNHLANPSLIHPGNILKVNCART